MFKFSKKSLDLLQGVHPLLVEVVTEAMAYQVMDFSVNEGVRTLERQKQLVAEGKSRTMLSKHLIQADGYGHAVDLYPSPVNMSLINNPAKSPGLYGKELYRFGVLSGIMMSAAKKKKAVIVNGADWDGDGETLDHTFFDAPHFQLVIS